MINNSYLKSYVKLYKEVKEREKELEKQKKELTAFLQARNGKQFITAGFIAQFQDMNKPIFNYPDDVKEKYKTMKHYDILKVTAKK